MCVCFLDATDIQIPPPFPSTICPFPLPPHPGGQVAVDIMRFPPFTPRPALSPSLHLTSSLSPHWWSDRSRRRRVPKPMSTCSHQASRRNIHPFPSPPLSRLLRTRCSLGSPPINRCPRRVHPRCPLARSPSPPRPPFFRRRRWPWRAPLAAGPSLVPAASHSAPFSPVGSRAHIALPYAWHRMAYALHLARDMGYFIWAHTHCVLVMCMHLSASY